MGEIDPADLSLDQPAQGIVAVDLAGENNQTDENGQIDEIDQIDIDKFYSDLL